MEKSIAEIEAELAQGEEQTAKTIQDRQLVLTLSDFAP